MTQKSPLLILVATALCIGVGISPALAADRKIKIVNDTSAGIRKLQARLVGTKKWSDNMIPSAPIPAFETREIVIKTKPNECVFDFREYDFEGELVWSRKNDICKKPNVVFR